MSDAGAERLRAAADLLVAEFQSRESVHPPGSELAESWRDRADEVGEMLKYVSGTPFEMASLQRYFESELAEVCASSE